MKEKQVLVLIDIQNDYFPGGNMELVGAAEAADKAGTVVNSFRTRNLPVIHIAHESIRKGATFFLPGSSGQKIHNSVAPLPEETVISKNFPNSFLATPLQQVLQDLGADHLLICGMMTHMCVDASTRAAKDLGFSVTLIHDATATRDLVFADKQVAAPQVQTAFTSALAFICDRVIDTDTLLQDQD